MRSFRKRRRPFRKFLAAVAGVLIVVAGALLLRTPSLERDWKTLYAVLPETYFEGDKVAIRKVRNFSYATDGSIAKADYYDADYDLTALESVWFGLAHFTDWGLAHSFLSFGFADGRYLAISIETRQEKGEGYSPVLGLLRNYELAYVIADERDIIGVRTHIRRNRVLLYELVLSKGDTRALLETLLEAAEATRREPVFYNTLTDNCTTSLAKYAPGIAWWQWFSDRRLILPGYADELAYELGLISNDRPLADLQRAAELDPAVSPDDPAFSAKIRND